MIAHKNSGEFRNGSTSGSEITHLYFKLLAKWNMRACRGACKYAMYEVYVEKYKFFTLFSMVVDY